MATNNEKCDLFRVSEQLATISSKFESLNEKNDLLRDDINEKYGQINKKLEKINELLMGNGNPEKGLMIRVDRLEQNDSRRVWAIRATFVACLGAIATVVASFFKA